MPSNIYAGINVAVDEIPVFSYDARDDLNT